MGNQVKSVEIEVDGNKEIEIINEFIEANNFKKQWKS